MTDIISGVANLAIVEDEANTHPPGATLPGGVFEEVSDGAQHPGASSSAAGPVSAAPGAANIAAGDNSPVVTSFRVSPPIVKPKSSPQIRVL